MKNRIKNFINSNFIYKGKEKLSKLTILFLVILDIFIFITLGLGIDFQIKVLNNPHVMFPNQCRNIINDKNLTDFNKYFYTYNNYNGKYQTIKNDQMDMVCNNILYEKLSNVKKEHNIKSLKSKDKRLSTEINKVNSELNYIRENYNTVLFEKLSSQNSDKSIIKNKISANNIKIKYDSYIKQNENLKKEKEQLKNSFKNSTSVKELVLYVDNNKKSINSKYKELRKSYKLKKELVTLAFLIPLLLLAFYLMKKYLLSERYTLYIMFKNVFVVIFIPTFFSLVSLIYILMPKVFIEKVLRFFYELEVPFIVYYLVIAFIVVLFGYIILRIQKKYKEESQKLSKNSISKIESYNKNICNICNNRVDYNLMKFCPCCQNKIKITCESCEHETINGLKFCINCSHEL